MSLEEVVKCSSTYESILRLKSYLSNQIIGQENLVTRLLITLLADGHMLLEGAPGLAKTTAVKTLAACINADFHRIQFTPDLLPADLTGTEIFRPQEGGFLFQKGPLFHSIILADEINRAPAKVQSALLEAMEERQITIGRQTYPLPQLFMVLATQNPIEQEGTYPLPEAQLDRFLMYCRIDYPNVEHEITILRKHRDTLIKAHKETFQEPELSEEVILKARENIWSVHLAPKLEIYITELVVASRNPEQYSQKLASCLQLGASSRATFALDRCSRAHAWLNGRDYVSPEDIQAVAPDILRHRLLLSFEAEAENVTTDDCVNELLSCVAIP